MITLERPWLGFDLGHSRRVLSFAPYHGGFVQARHILWREVRDADLDAQFEVLPWFAAQMAGQGMAGAVGFLTSRDVSRFCQKRVVVEGVAAHAVATVGLGNAECVGKRRHISAFPGTINIAVLIEAGLSSGAQLEALTIAAEARTAAIMQSGLRIKGGGAATGTGTDCIAIAADAGAIEYAGLHTAVGEAVGRAVYDAVAEGAADWIAAYGNVV